MYPAIATHDDLCDTQFARKGHSLVRNFRWTPDRSSRRPNLHSSAPSDHRGSSSVPPSGVFTASGHLICRTRLRSHGPNHDQDRDRSARISPQTIHKLSLCLPIPQSPYRHLAFGHPGMRQERHIDQYPFPWPPSPYQGESCALGMPHVLYEAGQRSSQGPRMEMGRRRVRAPRVANGGLVFGKELG